MAHSIPFLDLKTPHRELEREILAVWQEILREAAFIGGPELQAFEKEFADITGTQHCVGVGSGTDALWAILSALGIGEGDEVITVPHTFIATIEAISRVGAKPVFVDIDRDSATMDPSRIESAISPRTRAIMPVHLYGQPAHMDKILELARHHGLRVIEDAAQAHGAEYKGRPAGSMADAAAFSFYPGKNLGGCGEAGAVVTNNSDLAQRIRELRDHGQAKKYHHNVEGWNARLDALQAAALRIKLRRLDHWNEQRRSAAAAYSRLLNGTGLELPTELPDRKHVYHLYVVRHPERDRIQHHLNENNIFTGLHYPVPLHLQAAYEYLGHRSGDFPHAETWASHGLSLPMFPGLTEDQIERISELIKGLRLAEAQIGASIAVTPIS